MDSSLSPAVTVSNDDGQPLMMASDGQESETRITRRATAKKADQLDAKPLESSPVRSEDDIDRPLFGEPSHRKARVKVTYGKKATGRSPAKSSPAQKAFSGRSRPRSQPITQSRTKSPTRNGGNNALVDEVSSLSSLSDPEETQISIISSPSPLSGKKVKRKLARARSTPHAFNSGKKNRLKRKHSAGSVSSTEPDSEPEWPRKTGKAVIPPHSSPPSATSQFTPGSSRDGLRFAHSPMQRHAATAPSTLRKLTGTLSTSSLSSATLPDINTMHPRWGLQDHPLAFVRVDWSSQLSQATESMWWPAEITGSTPMQVTLFGQPPGSSPKSPARKLTIPVPTSEVIRPFCAAPRQLRFTQQTYTPLSKATDSIHTSPHKRQRTTEVDLDNRWCHAKKLMLRSYQRMNDGLPLTLSLMVKDTSPEFSLPPLQTKQGTQIVSTSSPSDMSDLDELWEPPESPYDIPGELVLAKEKRTYTQYWPAKLMRYIPPRVRGENSRYEVLFFDGTVKTLPDDSEMFYNETHPGFKPCLLGEDKDNYGLDEGDKDKDSDPSIQFLNPEGDLTDKCLREVSPKPDIPPPVAFASELPIEDQFRYVKPVLEGIMTGHYKPAKSKHVRFMKGGKQRNTVTAAAWKRGELTIEEKTVLSTCICRWMQRRQRRQELGFVPPDPFIKNDDVVSCSDFTGPREIHIIGDEQSDGSPLTELSGTRSMADSTERAASCGPQAPPSSFVSAAISEVAPSPEAVNALDGNGFPASTLAKVPTDVIDLTSDMDDDRNITANALPFIADGSNLSQSRPAMVTDNEPESSPSGTVPTYSMLSGVDQITYCTSVLLPEAILQILLWRNGERKSIELLSSAEEERLHRLAEEHASKTYWVHDIVRMKRAMEGNMLASASKSKSTDADVLGKTRLQSRRK